MRHVKLWMATMYLLDSNICIDFMRGKLPEFYETLRHANSSLYKIPTPVEMELLLGVEKTTDAALRSKRRKTVETFLRAFEVLPYDSLCARKTAVVRADLERRGRRIGPIDTLLAGMALAYSAVLVTNNVREFSRVEGLAIESWYDATDIWRETSGQDAAEEARG